MKVFLNLLAATTGGQITRARAFLDLFENALPDAEIVVLKSHQTLTEYGDTAKRLMIDVPIGLGRLKAARRMWWENTAMLELIRVHKPDVYLTFSHYLPIREIGIPAVVGVSNLAPFSKEAWAHEAIPVQIKMAVLRRTILSSAKRAASVLALSQTCRDLLIRYGVAPEKIVVSPNGVDTYWENPTSPLVDLNKFGIQGPFLLYVSHFHRYKNHTRLVEAFAKLPYEIRSKYQLVLVGNPDNQACYEGTRRLIARLELGREIIQMTGKECNILRALYQQTALFVFPSLIENCPNILLEAMMAGAPVASANFAPMPEFCESAAVYFDALSADDIATVIEQTLQSSELMSNMRVQARAQAHCFTWDAFATKVVQEIGKVLS